MSINENKKNWRSEWRKDKTTKRYKEYLKRRSESMKKTARKKLEELNKKMPKKYKSRKNN